MSDTAIIKRDPLDFLTHKTFRDKMAAAIPNAMMKPDRFLQLAITLIKSNTLMKCTPISLMACVMEAAQLGLELDPVLGHIYMVPFKDQATIIIGYKGFAQLMYQSGQVVGISAEIVRPRDKFKRTLGTNRGLMHDPAPIPKKDSWESWLGAYAVARMISDTYEFDYMEAEEIYSIRNRSRSWQAYKQDDSKTTPWITDAAEMWRKTPLRRLAKRMPRSTTDNRGILLRAVMLDEYGERKLLTPTPEGFTVVDQPEGPCEVPLEPTTETSLVGQLQDSIEYVETKRAGEQDAGRKGGKPGREQKKPPKEKPGPGPQRAAIPPESRINDPLLSVPQQTKIYNAAMQAGWQVPEEFSSMLKREYKINSIREARESQYADLLERAKGNKKA